MKFLKSHFALTRSQQNGIFVLIVLIIVLQAVLLFDFFPQNQYDAVEEDKVEMYREQLDSLQKVENRIIKKDTIYPFNPNFMTDFRGYQLGMSIDEIDRLLAYRNSGKWVNSPGDFQKVTGISDSLLKIISPAFRFPEWTQKLNSDKVQPAKPVISSSVMVTDLNSASAQDLKSVNGIGEVLSERIVKYRQSIGGFLDHSQLQDVYGLSPEVIENILLKFKILNRPDFQKKDINSINVADLSELPYFNYGLAKKLISYRTLHEGISSFEELSKIDDFPYDKIDRIKLYLTVK